MKPLIKNILKKEFTKEHCSWSQMLIFVFRQYINFVTSKRWTAWIYFDIYQPNLYWLVDVKDVPRCFCILTTFKSLIQFEHVVIVGTSSLSRLCPVLCLQWRVIVSALSMLRGHGTAVSLSTWHIQHIFILLTQGLGVPFNIVSYSLLTCMIAHVCNLKVSW